MRPPIWLLCTVILLLPASLIAAGLSPAMVHSYGASWLNGATVDHASAVFPGDLLQTNTGATLKIDAPGSTVTVLSDSVVKFEGDAAAIEHGSAQLQTSTSMSARAGQVTVTPVSSALTEFQVIRANGSVQVVALTGNLRISNGSQTATLAQGQQATQTSTLDSKVAAQGMETAMSRQKPPAFNITSAKAGAVEPDVRAVEQSSTKKGKGSPKLP
jgi:hypothetical protein